MTPFLESDTLIMEIDFGAIGQQAAAMAVDTTPAGATTDTLTASSQTTDALSAAASAQTTPAPTTPVSDPVTPGQPQLVEVDLGNGKVEKLTVEQLREAYNAGLRQSDYTRKMQDVAKQRQEAEAVMATFQQRQQELQSLLNNPQALLQLAAKQQPGAIAPQQQVDPNQPVTIGQLQQVLHQEQQRMAQGAQTYVEERLQVAQYAETINQTIGDLKKQYPVLAARPELEDVMRYNVVKMDPKTVEEAAVAFQTVAKELNDSFEAAYASRQQQAAQQRANLTKQGIETSGTPVPTQSPNFFQDSHKRNLDWSKLAAAALTQ